MAFRRGVSPSTVVFVLMWFATCIGKPPSSSGIDVALSTTTTTVSVLNFGAKGDGSTDDTKAFLAAWTSACNSESATILVPAKRVFILGPISFTGCKPGVTLQLDGIIKASTNPNLWNKGFFQWIEFRKIQNITLQGSGILDGQGSYWWKETRQIDNEMALVVPINGHQNKKPRMQTFSQHIAKIPGKRPTALRFVESYKVAVTGITLKNSPQFHLRIDSCANVHVHDMSVSSPSDSPNTDGIHLSGSNDVAIFGTNLACGDDCISIQTGCYNIRVRNVTCGPGHGISIGGLGKYNSKAVVSNISVIDIILHGTMTGVRIKTWQGGSGSLKGVLFSNIQVSEVKFPIMIDQFYCDHTTCKNQSRAVDVSEVAFERVSGTYTVQPIRIACSDGHPCTGITFTAIQLWAKPDRYRLNGPYCWHAFGELTTLSIPPINCLKKKS